MKAFADLASIDTMAMLFEVTYPSGEVTVGTGYPGSVLVIQQVPPGPESCLYDQVEVESVDTSGTCVRVVRIVGGPRRPTNRVRVLGGSVVRKRWMNARDAEGWSTLDGHDPDPDVVWVVALKDGMDPSTLGDVIPR